MQRSSTSHHKTHHKTQAQKKMPSMVTGDTDPEIIETGTAAGTVDMNPTGKTITTTEISTKI